MAKLGIMSDDLSGACDAAAEFAFQNLSSVVDITGMLQDVDEVEVVSVSTETRTASPAEALIRVADMFDRMARINLRFIYKKIDSTLRGNCRTEIDALLSVSQLERAFIVPAFPEAGRRVNLGSLYVNDDSSPALHIPSVLGKQHLQCISVHECTDQLSLGTGLFVVDTTTRAELKQAAQFIWNRLDGTLLVGSAGFAAEIAELMKSDASASRGGRSCPFPNTAQPVAFVVGSTHPQTEAQIEFLKRHRNAEFIHLISGWDIAARQSLLDRRDIVLNIDCDCIDFPELLKVRKLTDERLISAFIATGGYTARILCEAVGARAIRMYTSLLPGTAVGSLIGGQAHAIPIVTKSGGFGTADALARIVELLRDEKAA